MADVIVLFFSILRVLHNPVPFLSKMDKGLNIIFNRGIEENEFCVKVINRGGYRGIQVKYRSKYGARSKERFGIRGNRVGKKR